MIIINANMSPAMTIEKEKADVTSAVVVLTDMKACDRRPPVDDATISGTTGSSHVAAIFCTEWSWIVILRFMSGFHTNNETMTCVHGVQHSERAQSGNSGIQPPESPQSPEERSSSETPILVYILSSSR